jgi:hypothetical protein
MLIVSYDVQLTTIIKSSLKRILIAVFTVFMTY